MSSLSGKIDLWPLVAVPVNNVTSLRQGNTGNTGAPGATGAPGNRGNTGAPGSPGATGFGAPGGLGNTGAPGNQGNTGGPGATGSPGNGAPGNPGTTGAPGATGPPGNIGSPGTTGAPGATGTGGAQGNTGSPGAQGATGSSAQSYAQFVQLVDGTNNSIAPGRAVSYDTPVLNTIGITTNAGPAGQGTEFVLPIGTYSIDFENSNSGSWSLALYKSLTTGTEVIDNTTIAGASTAGSWIHGSSILVAAATTFIIVSPVVNTASTGSPSTGSAPQNVTRIRFVKIA
jgi:hypothetical protein